MNFDEDINRIGTHSVKWDMMTPLYGVPADTGLSMWVADMDFRPPAVVQAALEKMVGHGVYGYFGDHGDYLAAVQGWMATRHGWHIDRDAILTTHGIVNAVGLAIDAYTQPGDGVILMTPVYHAFARTIRAAHRQVVECRLATQDGRYVPDFAAWETALTGRERMFILCSPHNPGGRVWTADELRAVADFCIRHDLILVSDEIHHDLVFSGHRHIPTALAALDALDRLVVMTATTKTFNLAAGLTGNVIIPDAGLRARFADRLAAFGISGNAFGITMATAAYSTEGGEWLDALMAYLDENRRLFDASINALPGITSMPLEATYLAWVDFSGTGMSSDEVASRVAQTAQIAANQGATFGAGGESFLRFNLATPRARVEQAVARMQAAFADLQ
ncbi:MAG: pyridoxal phosphate-dependent aminotransferase [Rhodobacteraceae bacterium]|nr:pyridoxal phosphate-dependent aminotransferase [Paracoccaceae bacterium]